MTGSVEIEAHARPVVGAPEPSLPLVSVIVVNFNYGRYLAEAITSVFAQTYPSVECIVVDNASTDGSADVIAAMAARHPDLVVIRRADNGGQTAACLDGLARARGPYIVFLDADDYLLPPCLASHVAVHLSSRVHVGFTSGDMLQMVGGQVVLGTNASSCNFIAAEADRKPARGKRAAPRRDLLRPLALGDLRDRAAALAERVHLVPRDQRDWAWAPTSGNCFRRDALDLFCDAEGLATLASQTDLYLAMAVNALTGSILIDEPLFAYRLHGANVFSNRPQLQGCLSFECKRSAGAAALARRLLIDQLVGKIERLYPETWMAQDLLATLARVDTAIEDPGPWRGRSYAARAIARRFEPVAATVGRRPALLFMLRRAPRRLKLRLFLDHNRPAA